MTVQDTTPSVTHVGTGAQVSFPFTFRADDVAWLTVDFLTNFDQFILNADQDNNPGGTAEYTVAPPLAQELTIARDTANTQELDYTRYDPFDSESHEDALDKLTMQIQDIQYFVTTGWQQDFDDLDNVDFATKVDGSMIYWDDGAGNWVDTAAQVRYLGGTFRVDAPSSFVGNVSFEANASSISGNFFRFLNASNLRWADLATTSLTDFDITTPNLANARFIGFTGRVMQDAETLAYVSEIPVVISDHTLLSNIGVNTHVQIDTHIADGTIHFSEASIDHTAIANIGINSHGVIDSHIADATVHFVQTAIDHTVIANVGVNTHAQIDAAIVTFNSHIADASIHFADAPADGNDYARRNNLWNQVFSGVTDHTALTSIGVNTHVQIDAHIVDATIHFADAPADATSYVRNNNLWVPETPGGVTDHGALTGLADDDHPQYYNGTLVWTGNLQLGGFSLEECNEFDNLSGIYNFSTVGPGDPTNPDIVEGYIRIRSADFNDYASIGFPNDERLEIINRAHGGQLALRGENSGGTLQYLFRANPDLGVMTYWNGLQVTETVDPVIQGGLLVDNQLTGTGLERVLTQSDLNFGITGFGIWRYRVATDAFPAAGRLQFNNADPALATNLYVNEINDNSADMTNFLDLLADGDVIYLQVTDTSGQNVVVEIGIPVKNADVYTFPIASVNTQGTPFTNNASMAFVASIGAGAGGTNDHLLLINIGVNTHAQIDTHIADSTVHFLEASIDHTAISNIGVNSHAAIDTHIADGTIHFTEGSIDHGSIAGLADDDHTQYVLDGVGRAGIQDIIGGLAANDVMSLEATSDPARGTILTNSAVRSTFDWTSGTANAAFQWNPTIAASGGIITAFMDLAANITVNNALFILSALDTHNVLEWTVNPGFAVTTTFFGRDTFLTTTAGIAPAQCFVYAAQHAYQNNGGGAVTVTNYRALSFAPILRAVGGGDNLRINNINGLTVGPLWNTNNAGATADFGTIRGVHMLNPAQALFGQSLGTEECDNIIGLDYNNMTLSTSGVRAVVRSSLTNSASNWLIQNLGGADSDFGAGDILFNDSAGTRYGDSSDVFLFYNSAQAALAFSSFFGVTSNPLYLRPDASDVWAFQQDNGGGADIGLQFNVNAIAFGVTVPTPNSNNWFVQFAGPNLRQVQIGGEYSDVLWTASGSIDVNGQAVSDLQAFKINSPAVILNGGTISDISNLFVQAMPSFGATRTQALRVLGRARVDGRMNHGSEQPAQLTASVNNWQLAANNNQRAYVILTTDGSGPYNVTGIDSAFGFAQIGEVVTIYNASADTITFTHLDVLSLAANRLDMVGAAGVAVGPRESIRFWYDDQGSATWFHIQEQ